MTSSLTLWLGTAALSFLPISELRGGIPFALSQGAPWYAAYLFAAACNALVAPLCWLFLSTVHRLLLRWPRYAYFFAGFIERARTKLHAGVARWGWLGVALFVAIPLPMTGAWTGTLGAWVLGLGKAKTLAAVSLGVFTAGALVTAAATLGIGAFKFFMKTF